MTAKINKEKKGNLSKEMSWNSFPKAWKTIHVVTETFTQRRSECKFYLLHTVEYSFLSLTNEICFFRANYHL